MPGTVESWTGDPAVERHARSGPVPTPRELLDAAAGLGRALEFCEVSPVRRAFLAGELAALTRAVRTAAGERVPLAVEIEQTYGVRARPGDPDRYREAHRRLDALLPGTGDVGARLAALRRADEVPPQRRERAITALTAALRERTRPLLELRGDAGVTVELVEDRPWSGFTRPLGGGRSLARFTADAPLRAGQLARLVAHETYPGHHVEHLVRAASRDPERALSLTHGPRALVVEGAADLALDAAVGPGWGLWAAAILAEEGVHTDGALAEELDEAMLPLQRVRLDAALLADGEGVPSAAAHLRRWLLLDDARADRVLRFATDPRWRAYTATYVLGYPLVRSFVDRGRPGHAARFRRVLAEPLTPATLLATDVPHCAGRPSPVRGEAATDGVDNAMSGRPFC